MNKVEIENKIVEIIPDILRVSVEGRTFSNDWVVLVEDICFVHEDIAAINELLQDNNPLITCTPKGHVQLIYCTSVINE